METGEEEKAPGPSQDSEESWVAIREVGDETEAAILVGFFESQGIPAQVMDKSFHQTPTQNEDLIEIAVAVLASNVDEAERVLAEREAEFKGTPEGGETVLTEDGIQAIDVNPPQDPKE